MAQDLFLASNKGRLIITWFYIGRVVYKMGFSITNTSSKQHLFLRMWQEKLNLVKYLHLILRQAPVMVFSEHLHEVGIHFHTQLWVSYFSLGICGMLVVTHLMRYNKV